LEVRLLYWWDFLLMIFLPFLKILVRYKD